MRTGGRFRVCYLLFLLLFLGACAHGRVHTQTDQVPEAKRAVKVGGIPRYSYPYTPVVPYLAITNPTPEDYCPRVCCEWGDGSKSCRQSDCQPLGDSMDYEYLPVSCGEYSYRSPGLYLLRVSMSLNEKGETFFVRAFKVRVGPLLLKR